MLITTRGDILVAAAARDGARILGDVSFVTALAAAIGLLIGVPLLIVALSVVAGPVGWIVAAVVLPLAVLATILWLGRAQPGDGEPPEL
jgi:hypothetical protein